MAISREAPLFAGLLATLAVCSLMLRDGVARMTDTLSRLLDDPGRWTLRNGADAVMLFNLILQQAASLLVPVFVVFIVSGLAISIAQNVPNVVLDRIQPKLSKLNPMAGFKKRFGRDGMVEFGKALFKLLTVFLVVFLLLHSEQQGVVDAMFTDPASIPDRMLAILIRLLSGVATAFVVLAAADLIWTRVRWMKQMRMSRRDIKDEMRQAEGDPLFKAKRRSVALDRSRRRMISEVPRATLVIANPTHFAIALRYVRQEGSAPVVIAKGKDLIALKIREIAEQSGIAVIENKPLARSMYDHVEVGKIIPAQFYKAVAETIHYIQSRSAVRAASSTNTVVR
ncbi:MAG TPA: EscU/YscU/HrcU family type III secretion system export apparatus switch protein [Bradyrhizobium sp.]